MENNSPSPALPPARLHEDAIIDRLIALAQSRPDRQPEQFRSRIGAHQYRRLYRLWNKYVPAGSTVFDWGSGNGHFTYFLVHRGDQVTAMSFDGNPYAGTALEPTHRFIDGLLSEPRKLPFAEASFDAVVSVGVLEHVRESGGDEVSSLREIERILRPGGVFVCYHFPNPYSLVEAIIQFIPGKFRHLYRFTRDDIRALVAQTGLELLETHRYGLLYRNGWQHFPPAVRYSRTIAALWDLADDALGLLLNLFCQNHAFVVRKPR